MARLGSGALTLQDITDGEQGIQGPAGSTPSFERSYTTTAGLLTEIGDPDSPGTGVTWVSVGSPFVVPSTAFWVAERFTISGTTSDWQIFPVQAKDGGIPFVTGTTTDTLPTLNSAAWITDAILAVEAFTGRDYTTQKEFGYGTVVIISYTNTVEAACTGTGTSFSSGVCKLAGRFIRSGSTDVWVAPTQFIDGDLFVDGTIAADKIQANAITATQIAADTITANEIAADTITATEIAADTITADEIDVTTLSVQDMSLTGELVVESSSGSFAFGKTGPNDFDTPGVWMGHEGGHAYFLAGSSFGRYILFDGANGILFITGETLTGPAVVGASTSYTEATGDIRHDLPVSITSIKIEVAGAGGGGTGYDNGFTPFDTPPQVNGGAGGSTVVRHYNVSDVLQGTYTGGGGSAGGSVNLSYTSAPTPTQPPASGDGGSFTAQGSFPSGTGGQGINISARNTDNSPDGDNPSYVIDQTSAPMPGTGFASGGGGGMRNHSYPSNDEFDNDYGNGGGAGSYSIQASLSVSGGDYLIISVGAGGDGGGTGTGTRTGRGLNHFVQGYGAPNGDGTDGAARIEYLTTT